jgi:hypothetical protein
MTPPLPEYWKTEKNWVKRFVRGSFELNGKLCGIYVTPDTEWTAPRIRAFLRYMESIKQPLQKETTLYRGSWVISPTMHPACLEMDNCQFMSTSKSRAIATEFAGKKGYLHILECSKGVITYDLEEIYGEDRVKREKEVLLYPGCHLTFMSKRGNILRWRVSPPRSP